MTAQAQYLAHKNAPPSPVVGPRLWKELPGLSPTSVGSVRNGPTFSPRKLVRISNPMNHRYPIDYIWHSQHEGLPFVPEVRPTGALDGLQTQTNNVTLQGLHGAPPVNGSRVARAAATELGPTNQAPSGGRSGLAQTTSQTTPRPATLQHAAPAVSVCITGHDGRIHNVSCSPNVPPLPFRPNVRSQAQVIAPFRQSGGLAQAK